MSNGGAVPQPPRPPVTHPGTNQVVFENERIRVTRCHARPGDKTPPHEYAGDFFVYALSAFQRRVTFADGRSQTLNIKAGDMHWGDGRGERVGENIGQTDTHSLVFELLEPRPTADGRTAT